MSVLYEDKKCFFIDHRDYISKIYENIAVNEKEVKSYTISAKLFSILREELKGRKRSYDCDKFHEETLKVKKQYENFIKDMPKNIKENIKKYKLIDTSTVRDLSKELFESTIFSHTGTNGGNNSHVPLKCKIKDDSFLIPGKCRFYCDNVKDITKNIDSTFDIVIADPPWWNKYIRRLKSANDKLSYSMMYNEDIASIPVRNLLSSNAIIAVWCTNSPSNITAVKDIILPQWGAKYAATWYWLKVTVDLMPICDFGSGSKKQPYERIVLGTVGDVKDIPEDQLVVSVPSALHSHKPPLLDILSPYLSKENPETLELFARYLLPNTTSVGYEPLKWQHESLYEIVS